jgi:hypothetical protein
MGSLKTVPSLGNDLPFCSGLEKSTYLTPPTLKIIGNEDAY